jgi:hypothetical protein
VCQDHRQIMIVSELAILALECVSHICHRMTRILISAAAFTPGKSLPG